MSPHSSFRATVRLPPALLLLFLLAGRTVALDAGPAALVEAQDDDDAAEALVGIWDALGPRQGGIGGQYEFRDDGTWCTALTGAGDFEYRLEGNTAVLVPEDGEAAQGGRASRPPEPSLLLVYDPQTDRLAQRHPKIETQLLEKHPDLEAKLAAGHLEVAYERVGGPGSGTGSVIGTWRPVPEAPTTEMTEEDRRRLELVNAIRWRLTEDCRAMMRMPLPLDALIAGRSTDSTACNSFSVRGRTLMLGSESRSTEAHFRIDGDLLVLTMPGGAELRFRRWSEPTTDSRQTAPRSTIETPCTAPPPPRPPTWAEDEKLNRRIYIEGGEFVMGSPEAVDRFSEYPRYERPGHLVRLSPFVIQEHEVTNEEYRRFKPDHAFDQGKEKHPAVGVAWQNAFDYANWLEGRLPTEAEWEYACRAGTVTAYWSGNTEEDLARVGWYHGNSGSESHAVCQKPANPWGLCDMHGNVLEWVADWYGEYSAESQENPRGPSHGTHRVHRGGGFADGPRYSRSASRGGRNPRNPSGVQGFRVAFDAPPAPAGDAETTQPSEVDPARDAAAQADAWRGESAPTWAEDKQLNRRMPIPGGEFLMGSPEGDGRPSEHPQHRVRLSPFFIQEHEVTSDEYRRFKLKHRPPPGRERHPTWSVSWEDASAYAKWLGGRLPTEAEWEYACRAGTVTAYSSGETERDLARVGWYESNSPSEANQCPVHLPCPHPVGEKPANPLGLYDMHGNVAEWVADWYGPYSADPQVDPLNTNSASRRRLFRGGWFYGPADDARCAYRLGDRPGHRSTFPGFRVVFDTAPRFGAHPVDSLALEPTSRGKPPSKKQLAALRRKSDEDIALARQWIERSGNYSKAIEIYANALRFDPGNEAVEAALAEARAMRYMSKERFEAAKKGMTEAEVRAVLGQASPSRVKWYRDRKVVAWSYPTGPNSVPAAIWFREERDGINRVYRLDFPQAKPEHDRARGRATTKPQVEAVTEPPGGQRQPTPSRSPTAEAASPPPIPEDFHSVALKRSHLPSLDRALERVGSCCAPLRLTPKRPRSLKAVPPARGWDRTFAVIRLGRSTEVALMFEELAGDEVLVYADLDQDLDLTNEAPRRCRRYCRSFQTTIRYAGGTAEYAFWIRLLGGERPRRYIWYSRDMALEGTLEGRRFLVIDDNTNGFYNDRADIVVIDHDGDGKLDVDRASTDRQPRHRPLFHDGQFIRLEDVDPVAGTARFTRAGRGVVAGEVRDADTGRPIAGATVHLQPGDQRTRSDAAGRYQATVFEGHYDRIWATAPGFWNTTIQGEDLASSLVEAGRTRRFDFHLHAGACTPEHYWCGHEYLSQHSTTRSQVDLDSGAYGPRVGGYPEGPDVAWDVGDSLLRTQRGCQLAYLGEVDFEALTLESLKQAHYSAGEILGIDQCATGAVLGVRTSEGRYGKILIDHCDAGEGARMGRQLEFSWILYRSAGD